MYGLSFSKVLQESGITEGKSKVRHLSGGIQNLEDLMRPENISKLENLHVGVFCFLAFHPKVDNFISEYIEKGSLSSDSGRQIMVLFIGKSEMRFAKHVAKSDLNFGMQLDTFIHPAYEAVSALFPGKKMDLPGLVFFERLIQPRNSVYVPLSDLQSVSSVAILCRSIFSMAQNSYDSSQKKRREFSETFGVQLEKNRIRYERSQKTSFREWLIKIYNKIYDHRADILSVVSSLP